MLKTHRIIDISREFFWVILIPTIIVLNVAFLLRTLELYLVPTAHAATVEVNSPQVLGISTDSTGYKALKTSQNYDLVNIAPGSGFTFEVFFKNIGMETWRNSGTEQMRLRADEHPNAFRHNFWKDSRTPAFLAESEVAPGATGTFRFALKSPTATGKHAQVFHLETKSGKKISGGDITINYNVGTFNFHFQSQLVAQDYANINIEPGRGFTFSVTFKNLGPETWSNSSKAAIVLATNNAGKAVSPFHHQYWPSDYVAAKMKAKTVKPGESATFTFALQAPVKHGSYEENFFLKAGDVGLVRGGQVKAQINVKKEVVEVAAGQPVIKIGLYDTTDPVEITSDNNYTIVTENNETIDSVAADFTTSTSFDGEKFIINSPNKTSTSVQDIKFVPTDFNSIFTLQNYENRPSWNQSLNDNMFRGTIHIKYNEKNGEVWVIEEVPLESYLLGVAEAGNDNDLDYLKSLMIAARTYAYYHYLHPTKHADQEFLLGVSDGDQVYRGYGFELRSPNINQAVKETEGNMIMYQDEIVVTPYFSQTDGRTRAWEEVWSGGAKPWLVSVADPCCTGLAVLGHGVGMSAKGARYFAETGWAYEQILQYYYTGIVLKELY